MKLLRTILLAGLVSLLPIIKANSQDAIQIKGNPCLEWIADGIGDQTGQLDSLEEDYMRGKFQESNILYARTQFSHEFGPKMDILHKTLKGAVDYARKDSLRWPPQAVICFNKNGKITGSYEIAEGVQPLPLPKIDYARKMSERYQAELINKNR
jgi:hypothetical protein